MLEPESEGSELKQCIPMSRFPSEQEARSLNQGHKLTLISMRTCREAMRLSSEARKVGQPRCRLDCVDLCLQNLNGHETATLMSPDI